MVDVSRGILCDGIVFFGLAGPFLDRQHFGYDEETALLFFLLRTNFRADFVVQRNHRGSTSCRASNHSFDYMSQQRLSWTLRSKAMFSQRDFAGQLFQAGAFWPAPLVARCSLQKSVFRGRRRAAGGNL